MKLSLNPGRLAVDCLVLMVLHGVMLQVMAHTRIVEKVMASQFSRWELMVILAFFGLRLAVYFLIPAALATLLVWEILRRLAARSAS